MITLKKNRAKNILSRVKESSLSIATLYGNVLETTGSEIFYRLNIPSEDGKMENAISVDFNEFRKNIVTFPDEIITIYRDGNHIVIAGETGSIKMRSMGVEEHVFPEIGESRKEIPIRSDDVKKLALSVDPRDYAMTIDIMSKDGKIYFFSTYNLYWLTLIIKNFSPDEQIACSLHLKHILQIGDESRVSIAGNFSIVEESDLIAVSPLQARPPQIPLLAATLPDVITCRPINCEKLKDVTKIMAGVGEYNTVVLDFEPEQLILTSLDGMAHFSVPARSESTGTFYVDAQRLNRFIQATAEPTIGIFESPNGTKGLRISETDNNDTTTFFCIAERKGRDVK